MRFKQRLRVIQTIEDTTKRNVVRTSIILMYKRSLTASTIFVNVNAILFFWAVFQVRTIVTETPFGIDELEELFVLFKVSYWHIIFIGYRLCLTFSSLLFPTTDTLSW